MALVASCMLAAASTAYVLPVTMKASQPLQQWDREKVVAAWESPLGLPDGVASVDDITAEQIKTYGDADLDKAKQALEIAIFRAPPYEKENETIRRRNLALACFRRGEFSACLPNAREVVKLKRGMDAEMLYVVGAAMREFMESALAQQQAIEFIEKALEVDPTFQPAIDALAGAEAADGAAAPAAGPHAGLEEFVGKVAPAGQVAAAAPAGFEWGYVG